MGEGRQDQRPGHYDHDLGHDRGDAGDAKMLLTSGCGFCVVFGCGLDVNFKSREAFLLFLDFLCGPLDVSFKSREAKTLGG